MLDSSCVGNTRRFLGALAAGFLLLGACGDGDDSKVRGGIPDEIAELPDEDDLRSGLLTIADMPTGWTEERLEASDDPLCGIRLARLLDLGVDRLPSAGVTFVEDEDLGPTIAEVIGFVPSGRGPDVVPLVRKAFVGCEGDEIDGLEATVSELSFPALGDESVSYRVRLEDPDSGQTANYDLVYARSGDLIVVVFSFAVVEDTTALLEEYAPQAVEKATEALLSSDADDEASPQDQRTTTTDEPDVQAGATLASPYLQGTLDTQLPPGEPDEVSVIAVGPPQSATPVVVRNNTSDVVEVHLSATARDASGALVGSGEDQGVKPAFVEPGHLGIGYVYLGIDDPPPGTTLETTARGEDVDDDFGALPGSIAEHNLAPGQFGQEQVVGVVRNDNDEPIEGPISVLVMCFDEAGSPLSTASGFTDIETIDPGQQGSFSVDLFDEAGCPRYLIGASGFTF